MLRFYYNNYYTTCDSVVFIEYCNKFSCNGGNNGAITLTVAGGTSPYTFIWSSGATTQNLTSLSAGNYFVTINDANSCSTTASAVITEPSTVILSSTHTDVSCFSGNNGSINLTANGGVTPYSFAWSNAAITEDISTLTANTL